MSDEKNEQFALLTTKLRDSLAAAQRQLDDYLQQFPQRSDQLRGLAGSQVLEFEASLEKALDGVLNMKAEVRYSALHVLIHTWDCPGQAVCVCADLALSDPDDEVRSLAVELLGSRMWQLRGDRELAFLLASILKDLRQANVVRWVAYYWLCNLRALPKELLSPDIDEGWVQQVDWGYVNSFLRVDPQNSDDEHLN